MLFEENPELVELYDNIGKSLIAIHGKTSVGVTKDGHISNESIMGLFAECKSLILHLLQANAVLTSICSSALDPNDEDQVKQIAASMRSILAQLQEEIANKEGKKSSIFLPKDLRPFLPKNGHFN